MLYTLIKSSVAQFQKNVGTEIYPPLPSVSTSLFSNSPDWNLYFSNNPLRSKLTYRPSGYDPATTLPFSLSPDEAVRRAQRGNLYITRKRIGADNFGQRTTSREYIVANFFNITQLEAFDMLCDLGYLNLYIRNPSTCYLGNRYDYLGDFYGGNGRATARVYHGDYIINYTWEEYQDIYLKELIYPNYYDLLKGFQLKDKRKIPTILPIRSSSSQVVISYYRINTLEPIPNLISIDWISIVQEVTPGVVSNLSIEDCVLGTMVVRDLNGNSLNSLVSGLPTQVGGYPYKFLLFQYVDSLFAEWDVLAGITLTERNSNPRILRASTANNNVWLNDPTVYNDVNYDINHPLFAIDNQRAYDWHVKPQSDGSLGTLIMDSPRTIEIHSALEAAKYKAEVPAVIGTGTADNPEIPAIRTLGYSIVNGGGQKLNDIHAALEAAKYKTEVPAVIGTGTADNPQIPAIRTLGYSIVNGGGQKLDDIHKALEASKYSKEVAEVLEVKDSSGQVTKEGKPAIHTLAYSIARNISPQVSQLHTALNAAEYSIDSSGDDSDKPIPRVATLAWHINRQSEILGIRVRPNGKINLIDERTVNLRRHVEGTATNDEREYNPNCFGSKGMLLRHLPNKFTPNGVAAGGYRKVKDIPQILAELHEQSNSAMGYQEGTAIEIKLDDKTYRYPNQLALLTELFVTAKQTATYSKGAFFSSLIGEQSIKEVIGGLGLRTVDKFVEFTVAKKTVKLYYKGISASQSIRRKLSAVTTNIGIAIGNII